MAIDWSFISQKGVEGESTHKTGYVPPTNLPSRRGSGFTVGSLDVGQHSDEDIRTMLQSYANKLDPDNPRGYGNIRNDLRKKLAPYVKGGKVGSIWDKYGSQEGYDMLAKTEEFKKEDIDYIMNAKRYQFENQLKGREGWDKLSDKQQTIISSFGWQWGTNKQDDDRNRFEELWTTRDNKSKMGSYLRKSGEESGYKGRRDLEANYIDPLPIPVQEVMNENNKIGQIK